MLEPSQAWTHPDGRKVTITLQMPPTQAIGEIFAADLTLGELAVSVSVTEAGLTKAGFTLQPPV